jgi:hypothetical protein
MAIETWCLAPEPHSARFVEGSCNYFSYCNNEEERVFVGKVTNNTIARGDIAEPCFLRDYGVSHCVENRDLRFFQASALHILDATQASMAQHSNALLRIIISERTVAGSRATDCSTADSAGLIPLLGLSKLQTCTVSHKQR